MIDFGETLRKAREAKGLTTQQIADTTHMMIQMVEEIEHENFSRIAAPIYGRGFVKLYCEAVGIDPKPLIAAFMDIYSGNRPPTIRRNDGATISHAVLPPAAPVDDIPDCPPQSDAAASGESGASDFSLESDSVPAHTPAMSPSRYAPPMPQDERQARQRHLLPPGMKMPTIKINWRLTALIVGAVIVLWALFAGIRAVYRMTMTPSTAPTEQNVVEEQKPTVNVDEKATGGTKEKPAKRSGPITVSPLYIDGI